MAPGGPGALPPHEWIDGPADAPVLVYLHEALGCISQWGGFPAALCSAAQCPGLVYDRAGHGRSEAQPSPRTLRYLHEAALGELPELLQALIPGRPYVLVGHSDGGSLALIHAASGPAQLLGVVSEAAHVFVEPATLEGIRNARAARTAGKLQGLERHHGAKAGALFDAWADTWTSPAFQAWNLEALLASIRCPVLALQGKRDAYGTEAQVAAIAAGVSGPVACLLLEACGHIPHREAPERVIPVVASFIGRLRAG